jgi:hypothetical protein
MLCYKERVQPLDIDINKEYAALVNKGLMQGASITEQGELALSQLFPAPPIKVKKPKAKKPSDIEIPDALIEYYRMMWPAKLLDSGKYARQPALILKKTFQSFFTMFTSMVEWDIILLATAWYLEIKTQEDFAFSHCSQYFILRHDKDSKSIISPLADMYQRILDGQYPHELPENVQQILLNQHQSC